ncbi:MAG TPA: class II aldolase/adducin family protein [Patescibacteria group bacterium]|nr:class II aldolase/adducin family protein [Patescibacteria group bacterium]
MEKTLCLLGQNETVNQILREIAREFSGSLILKSEISDSEVKNLLDSERPAVLIDGRQSCEVSDPGKWRTPIPHLFAIGISNTSIPFGKPWNLFILIRHESLMSVFTPEGGEIPILTVSELARLIIRRQGVTWSKSLSSEALTIQTDAFKQASDLLAFTKAAYVFPDRNGNCSWFDPQTQTLLVTPRQVEKSACEPKDLIPAKYDPEKHILRYAGTQKPSIDTPVQATLYRALPDIRGFLHIHPAGGIFLPDAITDFPYPCGAQEEALTILACLRAHHITSPFMIELIHHGFLIGLEHEGATRLNMEWQCALSAYSKHLEEIGRPDLGKTLFLQPIMTGARIIGVFASEKSEGWSSCFLLNSERGRGYGRRILKALEKTHTTIRAHTRCEVADFYLKNSWKICARDSETLTLQPPQLDMSARQKEA